MKPTDQKIRIDASLLEEHAALLEAVESGNHRRESRAMHAAFIRLGQSVVTARAKDRMDPDQSYVGVPEFPDNLIGAMGGKTYCHMNMALDLQAKGHPSVETLEERAPTSQEQKWINYVLRKRSENATSPNTPYPKKPEYAQTPQPKLASKTSTETIWEDPELAEIARQFAK